MSGENKKKLKDRDWDIMYQSAVNYYNTHGNLNVPDYYIDDDSLRLG